MDDAVTKTAKRTARTKTGRSSDLSTAQGARREPLDPEARASLAARVAAEEAATAEEPEPIPPEAHAIAADDVAPVPTSSAAHRAPEPLPVDDVERHLTSLLKLGGTIYAFVQLNRGHVEDLDALTEDARELAADVAPEVAEFAASRFLRPLGAVSKMLSGALRFAYRRAARAGAKTVEAK